MKTAIINSDSYEKHFTGDGHPEQPKRVIAIKEKLKTVKNNQELADNSHLIIYGGFATHLYGIEKRLQPYYTQDLDIKFVCPPDSNIDINL